MVAPFDMAAGKLTGSAIPVLGNVMASQCGPVPFSEYGMAMVDVAADGKLIYLPGGLLPVERLELAVVTADARPQLLSNAQIGLSPRVAPDGRRVLIGSSEGLLLIYPDRGQADLTIDVGHFGIFSPDGGEVAYMDGNRIRRRASDGTGESEVVVEASSETYAADWSADGNLLLVISEGDVARARWGIWSLDLNADADGAPRRLFGEEGSQSFPALSPGERWLAYTEGMGNSRRVFITSYPGLEGRQLVGAGRAPVWSADGRTLYIETQGATMITAVDVADPQNPGAATDFMPMPNYAWSAPVRGYDVFPDGRVVFPQFSAAPNDGVRPSASTHIELVLDWFTEVERLVPTER
jgi:hypothetical protein